VAQGDGKAIADEVALKMIETLRVPVAAFELEEIIHGPFLAFSEQTAVLYLGGADARAQALLALNEERGGRSYAVKQGNAVGHEGRWLTLRTTGEPLLAAYELLIPGQVISAVIAPAKGNDIDSRAHHPLERALAGHL